MGGEHLKNVGYTYLGPKNVDDYFQIHFFLVLVKYKQNVSYYFI